MTHAAYIDRIARDDTCLSDLRLAWQAMRDSDAGDGAVPDGVVRGEVRHSWRRCRSYGLLPERVERREAPTERRGERLMYCAESVFDELGDQLDGTSSWATVLDREGVQLLPTRGAGSGLFAETRVGAVLDEATIGTSGPASALETMATFVTVGPEHYLAEARGEVTVGVPVRDLTNRIVGVVAAGSRLESASGVLVSFATIVASQLHDRLVARALREDGDMLRRFRGATRRDSRSTMLVSERLVIANAAARQLVLTRDNPEAIIVRLLQSADEEASSELQFDDGTVPLVARVERVRASADGPTALATFHQRAVPPARDLLAEPVARIRRARSRRMTTLVYGESGSGRLTLILDGLGDDVDPWTTDARLCHLDADAWLRELQDACARERVVIVRHLDELPETAHRPIVAVVENSAAWCVMTSTTSFGPGHQLFGMFSVILERTPLRERRDEFPGIVQRMLRELGLGRSRCRPEVLTVFARHEWPGNLVQLRRVLAGTASRSPDGEIAIEYLPYPVIAAATATEATGRARREHEALFRALLAANWNREEAAERLGISRATLYRRIRRLGVTVPTRRSAESQSETSA